MAPSPGQVPWIPRQGRAADHRRRATSLRRLANPNNAGYAVPPSR